MGLISLWGSWSTQAGWRRRPATWRIRGTVDGQIVEKEEPSTHPGIVTRPRPHLSDDQTFREAPIVLSSNGILLRAPQAERLMGSQGRVNHCYWLPRTLAKKKLTGPEIPLFETAMNPPTVPVNQN